MFIAFIIIFFFYNWWGWWVPPNLLIVEYHFDALKWICCWVFIRACWDDVLLTKMDGFILMLDWFQSSMGNFDFEARVNLIWFLKSRISKEYHQVSPSFQMRNQQNGSLKRTTPSIPNQQTRVISSNVHRFNTKSFRGGLRREYCSVGERSRWKQVAEQPSIKRMWGTSVGLSGVDSAVGLVRLTAATLDNANEWRHYIRPVAAASPSSLAGAIRLHRRNGRIPGPQ